MVSVSCFGVRVSVMFHFMFVHYTFSSVWIAEWPPFGKYLPARLVFCSHCILSICYIYLFPTLDFASRICLLIGLVPLHCFSITFTAASKNQICCQNVEIAIPKQSAQPTSESIFQSFKIS